MLTLNAITILLNGLTLSLALGFLIIVLWYNISKELNVFFAIFLIFVIVWNSGSFLLQASLLLAEDQLLTMVALSVMELGFTGSSVAAYTFVTVLNGVHRARFRYLAFASLALIIAYRLFLIVNQNTQPAPQQEAFVRYEFQPLFIVFYLLFDVGTLYLTWRYRRKTQAAGISTGLVIFVVGQSLTFINPQLVIASFATSVSSIGVLLIAFGLIRQEIIKPLGERSSQLETMHRVSLAITSQISIDTVLNEIARQAASWLKADAVGIFLTTVPEDETNEFRLVGTYNLPRQFVGTRTRLGEGVVGTVAQTEQSVFLENYVRDWTGHDDLPLARETFGSVIAVPLIYSDKVTGVLMVIAGQQGRLFSQEDTYLLELLGSQAAVAIAHSRLFEEQKQLTNQVEAAHQQLESVLSGTENPVIAVDRQFRVIFVNEAGQRLFTLQQGDHAVHALPEHVLPDDLLAAQKAIWRDGGYVYEIVANSQVYLCHLATIGEETIEGWVAVLNDVTELKELDRLKSEMVRMASHDLKNPLMGARAYLDLIRDEAQASAGDVVTLVDTVEQQLDRMNRIIRGILDLERMAQRSTAFQRCDPEDIVANAADEMEHLAAREGVTIKQVITHDGSYVMVDQEQFSRVLVNLIENAIKFTGTHQQQGRVDVHVTSEDGHVVFQVSDNGVGIPAKMQTQIFNRFFRGNQPGVEHVSGTGLGLSLVKSIVENHDGKIWFESTVGEGTTFFVSVPEVK